MYPVFAAIFFATILISCLIVIGLFLRPRLWRANLGVIKIFCVLWYLPYLVFVLFFTGPEDLAKYPPQEISPYKLPWLAGATRFVAQGNRSFTSHRGVHLVAWDFVMPVGTVVLAARDGIVIHVEVDHDGVGLLSNYIAIQHEDGDRTGYAHLQKDGSLVKVGEHVKQGQPIGLSGMVGQTIFPHLHFFVTGNNGAEPKPISFRDVLGGVPLAGHLYTSENKSPKPSK